MSKKVKHSGSDSSYQEIDNKFKNRFTDLKDLKQVSMKIGFAKFEEEEYEEAIQCLRNCSLDEEIIRILILCHYELGKSSASNDKWSEAQGHFKYILEEGERGRLIQERLRLLSERMKNPRSQEELYRRGKAKGTIRMPTINKTIYLPEIDDLCCVGVYKWAGDFESADEWSRLLRRIKRGNSPEVEKATDVAGIALFECITKETKFRKVVDLIIPVPPDPERQKERTFNIPTLLAETISRYSTIPVFDDILTKTRSTAKRSSTKELATTLQVNYQWEQLKGKSVMIIDDITTHGHTFKACGAKLKATGVKKIYAATLAHSEPTSPW